MSAIEELAKEERRLYYQKWRAENKDKIRKQNSEYWIRKAEKVLKEKEEKK